MSYLDTEEVPLKGIIADRVKKILQNTIKVGNIILGIFGILILLYSSWMLIFCIKNYQQYIFAAWFLWACTGTGIVFIIMGLLGHAAASSRRRFVLSYYVAFKGVLLFIEALVTADVFLNDHWKKDFPTDPTQRFENFIAYTRLHSKIFNILATTLLLSQALSFLMAIFLRTMFARFQSQANNDNNNNAICDAPYYLKNTDHIVTFPYAVVGYPYPTLHDPKEDKEKTKQSMPHSEREVEAMSKDGYVPVTSVDHVDVD